MKEAPGLFDFGLEAEPIQDTGEVEEQHEAETETATFEDWKEMARLASKNNKSAELSDALKKMLDSAETEQDISDIFGYLKNSGSSFYKMVLAKRDAIRNRKKAA